MRPNLSKPARRLRSLPLTLLNTILAASLGWMVGGADGAVLGGKAALAILMMSGAGAWAWRHRLRLLPFVRVLFAPIGLLAVPLLGAFGIVLIGGAILKACIPAWPGNVLRSLTGRIAAAPAATIAWLGSFLRPDRLPFTLAGFLLLIVLGTVTIGIEVALYCALAAVPLLILGLAWLAIASSAEPDDGSA